MLCGLASITKQAGVVMIPIFVVFLTLLFTHSLVKVKRLVLPFSLLLFPIGSFYLMYSLSEDQLFGNLSVLENLVQNRAKEQSLFTNAIEMLTDRVSVYLIALLAIISSFCFFYLKKLKGQMGLVFLVFCLVGFYIYSWCCAYWPRNGWWIYSLLICAAIISFWSLDRHIEQNKSQSTYLFSVSTFSISKYSTIFIILIGLFGAHLYNNEKLLSWNNEKLFSLVSPGVVDMLESNLPAKSEDWIITSPYQAIKWLPGYREHYVTCFGDNNAEDKLLELISKQENVYVLASDHRVIQSFKGLTSAFPEECVIESKKIKKLYGNTVLYGPFGKEVYSRPQ